MRVLVTGGAGFIGSHTVEALLERGDEVVCLDNFNDYYSPERKRQNVRPASKHPTYKLVQADIRDAEAMAQVFKTERVERVVHLAAMAGVLPSIQNPLLYQEVNVKGTLHLLEVARSFGVEQFVLASSSSVYGANSKIPFEEDDRVDHPISPYAATKRAAELLAFTYSHLYHLNCAALRLFTVYGPRGRPDMAPYRFTQSVFEGRPIRMYGDGTSQRDYTYVGDVVRGVVATLDRPMGFQIFNIGNSTPVPLKRFIATIEEAVGRKAIVEQAEVQAGDVPVTYADVRKAQRLLGYAPTTSIEEGLRRFVAWYRQEVL